MQKIVDRHVAGTVLGLEILGESVRRNFLEIIEPCSNFI